MLNQMWPQIYISEAVLTSTHNLCFEQKYENYQNFYPKIFIFLVVKFSVYLDRLVFVMHGLLYADHILSQLPYAKISLLQAMRCYG